MLTKVLAIDDDPLTTELLKSLLKKEFEVLVVNSGQEGIEAVEQFEPDVIVLDLMMPGIDGWQACRIIRTFSQVPILIVSAVIDSERVGRALEEGATDYLIKPVPPGVMVSRLKRLAKNYKGSA